jgi:hypothetical protein
LGYQSDNLDPFTRHLAADELRVPYGAADADETFLLDFFIGSMSRNHQAYGKYGAPDLTGTTLTLYGKHRKTRTVEITERMADAIRERRKRNKSTRLFVSRNGRPTNTCSGDCRTSRKRRRQRPHTDFISCARLAPADGT